MEPRVTWSRPRYFWFKLSLAGGSLLSLLILAQSIFSYYQVSTSLVSSELRRESQRQLALLEATARGLSQNSPASNADPSTQLLPLLNDLRQEAPKKIAWIKLLDGEGRTLVQSGNSVGPPFAADRLQTVFNVGGAVSEIREAPAGKVLVTVHSVRLPRRLVAEPSERQPEAEANREAGRGGERPLRPTSRFIEMALYWDSASEAFVPLRADLIVGCLAALGLAISVAVLWTRFPHYIRGKQLEQQTELARQVQADLLPSPGASFENVEFAAASIPAMQVGGDFYDAFSTGDGRVALVVGDVSGKGLPAAVVVGLLLGAARASNWLEGASEHEASIARLSELLRARTSLETFTSLFSCCYEPKTRELRYVNAGHPPPILVRQSGGAGQSFERLEEGGPVLGVVAGAQYRQSTVSLCPGDLLVLFTDGVAEASKAIDDSAAAENSNDQFGEERLLQTIRENRSRSCAEIRDEILRRVHGFLDGSPAEDDLTLVVARVIQNNF